jgi:hypothetical protein
VLQHCFCFNEYAFYSLIWAMKCVLGALAVTSLVMTVMLVPKSQLKQSAEEYKSDPLHVDDFQ